MPWAHGIHYFILSVSVCLCACVHWNVVVLRTWEIIWAFWLALNSNHSRSKTAFKYSKMKCLFWLNAKLMEMSIFLLLVILMECNAHTIKSIICILKCEMWKIEVPMLSDSWNNVGKMANLLWFFLRFIYFRIKCGWIWYKFDLKPHAIF